MSSMAASTLVPSSNQNIATSHLGRHCADFHPNLWKDYFIQYASESLEVDDENRKHIETLKEEVRKMLVPTTEKPLTKVKLIDSIQRLGLCYHFEREIDEILNHIHNNYVENGQIMHSAFQDLHSLALLFRLLRQRGHHISPDVYNKFKDKRGNFSEELMDDVEGMLSLYEAALLSIHGEDILDEALDFTSNHLRSITIESNPFLAAQVHHSLRQSLHRGLPRLEARKYISIYHQHPSHNQVLLKLAKLDFNILQKLHQQEFGNICLWWNNLDVPRNLSYARDRIVECCFWILGVYFEPQYSQARRIMTKTIAFLSIIDDTFDAYGTINELELLTQAIERWDICCLDDLPEYLKLPYKELLNVFEETDEEMTKEGRSYSVHYTIKEFKKVVQAYMTEARWLNRNYVPTTEEYLKIATVSCCYPLLSTASFIGMGQIATEDIFKWAETHPRIFRASSIVCRIMDDIVSNEFEQKRGHVASLVECYMKDHGVSRDKAIEEFGKRIENAWKDINQECLLTQVPMPFLMRVLNLTRFIDVFYKHADNYTHAAGLMKDSITALLVDPFPI